MPLKPRTQRVMNNCAGSGKIGAVFQTELGTNDYAAHSRAEETIQIYRPPPETCIDRGRQWFDRGRAGRAGPCPERSRADQGTAAPRRTRGPPGRHRGPVRKRPRRTGPVDRQGRPALSQEPQAESQPVQRDSLPGLNQLQAASCKQIRINVLPLKYARRFAPLLLEACRLRLIAALSPARVAAPAATRRMPSPDS
uniref:Uncharacterized protein n=1 Tax=Ectopseudomonas oleovorans TaxID=301 RepID=A0A653B228_ECTOL